MSLQKLCIFCVLMVNLQICTSSAPYYHWCWLLNYALIFKPDGSISYSLKALVSSDLRTVFHFASVPDLVLYEGGRVLYLFSMFMLSTVAFSLAVADSATNCVHWQWFSEVFLNSCSNFHYRVSFYCSVAWQVRTSWLFSIDYCPCPLYKGISLDFSSICLCSFSFI